MDVGSEGLQAGDGWRDGMELKFFVFPFLPIVCPRALRIPPLQVSSVGSPPHIQRSPTLADNGTQGIWAWGFGYVTVSTQSRVGATRTKSPVSHAQRSGAWSGRHEAGDIGHDKSQNPISLPLSHI